MVRALDCHSRGRGFEPRRPRRYTLVLLLVQVRALVVKLVDTQS